MCDTVETEECFTKYEQECETFYKERCSTEHELECTTGEQKKARGHIHHPMGEMSSKPPMAKMGQEMITKTARLSLSITNEM